ncbi:MAG TPA: hypothetical protein VL728_11315 [Cyclobacteriaceae bacterium]|jgi:hypothetical protein|nr:hypothetical protein [Cyclobacteriaceae bacterium]
MNYKPDESTLISYLYDELSDKEKTKLENYFQQHPEELAKWRALGDVRDMMSFAQDKEVIAPPVFVDDSNVRSLWQSSYFKISIGIAASIVFLLVAGKILGPEISYSKGELKISFGNKKVVEPVPANSLTEEKVREMISASLASNNEKQQTLKEEDEKRLMQSLVDMNSRKMDVLAKNASLASREQVQAFVAGLQEQNLKLMKDYFQLSSTEQKKYMESLLTDFSGYLQEQRKQDLQLVESQMKYYEKNNNQFKQETEQILTSLIASPNRSKNNY